MERFMTNCSSSPSNRSTTNARDPPSAAAALSETDLNIYSPFNDLCRDLSWPYLGTKSARPSGPFVQSNRDLLIMRIESIWKLSGDQSDCRRRPFRPDVGHLYDFPVLLLGKEWPAANAVREIAGGHPERRPVRAHRGRGLADIACRRRGRPLNRRLL